LARTAKTMLEIIEPDRAADGGLNEYAESLHEILRDPYQNSVLCQRGLQRVSRQFARSLGAARSVLGRELAQQHTTLLFRDPKDDVLVGRGLVDVYERPYRLRVPVPHFSSLVHFDKLAEPQKSTLGAHVHGWVDMRRRAMGTEPLRSDWQAEMTDVYMALRQTVPDASTWTIEPSLTTRDGMHEPIISAGFEPVAEGRFYDDVIGFQPKGVLYVASPVANT
jgi:hypothetical protein